MNNKINKIFTATTRDVSRWQKRRIKTSVLEQLKNWQEIDHINLVNFAPLERTKKYNQLFTNLNYRFIMKTTERIFNGTTVIFEEQKREKDSALNSKVFHVVSLKKGIGGIERDIKVTREENGAKIAAYESESKNGAKNVLFAVYKDGAKILFSDAKKATKLESRALAVAYSALWQIESSLIDVDLAPVAAVRAADEKTAQLLHALKGSANFVKIAGGIIARAAVVDASEAREERARKNADLINEAREEERKKAAEKERATLLLLCGGDENKLKEAAKIAKQLKVDVLAVARYVAVADATKQPLLKVVQQFAPKQ